jgi:hypothetical protein
LDSIKESAASGKLLVICGAGTSMALAHRTTPAASWQGLISDALQFAFLKGTVDAKQLSRSKGSLESGDLDELLGVATFVSRKLGGQGGILYSDWLMQQFSSQKCANGPMKAAILALQKSNIPIATLNYDHLLEKATKLPPVLMDEPRKVMGWARREQPGILHLHGSWEKPQTIVLAVEDYAAAVSDEFRSNLQRTLLSFNRALFIGCGSTLSDPNLSSVINWLRKFSAGAILKHYALVRTGEVAERHQDPLWHGFVDPIGYGDRHDDLPQFIMNEVALPTESRRSVSRRAKQADSLVVDHYRSHLIRDCGKMTIEGVRADDDTANQKFDLEKLFVPLEVNAIPPEYPANDPKREEKLKRWHKLNGGVLSFGEALQRSDRIALLALPGGGKTLLLKRLAVAYADHQRRQITGDNLPDLDVLPLMVRCREWRSFINLPISAIIEKIPDITGNRNLAGLLPALESRLKSGRILLLVDGLDEIHNDADRTTFVEHLESFLTEYPKIRLVVTSREAGFALVAPCLMRFCTRWRIAPLNIGSISQLCHHWHDLMSSSAKDSSTDSREVVEAIEANPALGRLAENPLLLTMLLVVKHGYGRLPPDRVSLYWRAVEVLLDTWNIKGHSALSPKEAVPQLAYIAFRLLQQGKQTATEMELLQLIEECRVGVPLIRFYARDTPEEFLKRVELRSSLLLEAGRQIERGRAVPFYQFRHLTFQEYLAAVAVVEGHYDGYQQGEPITEPFKGGLVSERWKEVVPMAAVLAKKQANPLIVEMISLGEIEEADLLNNPNSGRYSFSAQKRMPAPISRLAQCLIEEAEFSQETLDSALRLIATFAHGCMPSENWPALRKGPFGDALSEVAWKLFVQDKLPRQAWIRNTVALLSAYQKSPGDWRNADSAEEIKRLLLSDDLDAKGKGAATVCGLAWLYFDELADQLKGLTPLLEANLVQEASSVGSMTAWALAMVLSRSKGSLNESHALIDKSRDVLVEYWLEKSRLDIHSIFSFAVSAGLNYVKSSWQPTLDGSDVAWIRKLLAQRDADIEHSAIYDAAGLIAYHSNIPLGPDDVIFLLRRTGKRSSSKSVLWLLAAEAGITEEQVFKSRKKRAPQPIIAGS